MLEYSHIPPTWRDHAMSLSTRVTVLKPPNSRLSLILEIITMGVYGGVTHRAADPKKLLSS